MYSKTGHVISGVVKNTSGEITAYQFENGDIVTKEQAVTMAKEGNIKGVSVSKSKKGEEYLRTIGDGEPTNNLTNLPVIDENELK